MRFPAVKERLNCASVHVGVPEFNYNFNLNLNFNDKDNTSTSSSSQLNAFLYKSLPSATVCKMWKNVEPFSAHFGYPQWPELSIKCQGNFSSTALGFMNSTVYTAVTKDLPWRVLDKDELMKGLKQVSIVHIAAYIITDMHTALSLSLYYPSLIL
jgi:hypothetical protein